GLRLTVELERDLVTRAGVERLGQMLVEDDVVGPGCGHVETRFARTAELRGGAEVELPHERPRLGPRPAVPVVDRRGLVTAYGEDAVDPRVVGQRSQPVRRFVADRERRRAY